MAPFFDASSAKTLSLSILPPARVTSWHVLADLPSRFSPTFIYV